MEKYVFKVYLKMTFTHNVKNNTDDSEKTSILYHLRYKESFFKYMR